MGTHQTPNHIQSITGAHIAAPSNRKPAEAGKLAFRASREETTGAGGRVGQARVMVEGRCATPLFPNCRAIWGQPGHRLLLSLRHRDYAQPQPPARWMTVQSRCLRVEGPRHWGHATGYALETLTYGGWIRTSDPSAKLATRLYQLSYAMRKAPVFPGCHATQSPVLCYHPERALSLGIEPSYLLQFSANERESNPPAR